MTDRISICDDCAKRVGYNCSGYKMFCNNYVKENNR